ncbi:MAG: hypothetical protein FJ008_06800 [Chloroflexi bacterium]|nr:hypothetical protein [Chloroflexota bacterium]MBM3155030.1 hypothetical protein [Chloroflexota bacterium]MBM3175663.1 hypothetical protein [Chloroflexota bacterium]
MSYKDNVLNKIRGEEQRANEREELWQTIACAFAKEGPEGVANELARQMSGIRKKFDTTLAKLDDML